MDKYYCYIFYDENWCAYYVGYASHERRVKSGHSVPIPDKEHRQIIRFKTSWEALECERELVAFWGRECDGGCLKNKAVGGTIGPVGCSLPKSAETRKKIGDAHRGKGWINAAIAKAAELKRKPITVRHIETKQILSFPSHREMARQLNIDRSTLRRYGKTKGWVLVS